MSKIVISMLTAIIAVGCTTVVVEYPVPDASTTDASVTADAATTDDATTPTDASDGALDDAAVVADAASDAVVVPDVCNDAANPDCCFNGQPIRVGLLCGDYPDSADAICDAVGVCDPQLPQECNLVNACCDGWRGRSGTYGGPCYCVPTEEWVAIGYKGCSTLPQHQSLGGGTGTCVNINQALSCAVYTP